MISMNISANISGAKVYLDGKYVGTTDGGTITITDVPAGTHIIRAEKEGYNPAEATITVPETTTVTLKLTKKTYTVTIKVVD